MCEFQNFSTVFCQPPLSFTSCTSSLSARMRDPSSKDHVLLIFGIGLFIQNDTFIKHLLHAKNSAPPIPSIRP